MFLIHYVIDQIWIWIQLEKITNTDHGLDPFFYHKLYKKSTKKVNEKYKNTSFSKYFSSCALQSLEPMIVVFASSNSPRVPFSVLPNPWGTEQIDFFLQWGDIWKEK